ncbi:MAG: redoxin domain-containing protein, partial [Actinomycetota bacterium]|nr:redoxin domain-containing protein [Actinomycetota bacterium]
MAPEVDTEAPDFSLQDQNKQPVTLSSFRGDKAVLIVFYPFAFSGVCTGELNEIREDLDTFQNDRVQVLPISVDHPFT